MKDVLKKMFVAALLCLVQTTVCTADTFKGKIVNAETGEILIGATVRSEINPEPGWSMQNSTETDSTGCFTLDSEWGGTHHDHVQHDRLQELAQGGLCVRI